MALVALLSLSQLLFFFTTKNIALTQAQCLPDQRHALIELKQDFNTTELHSWNVSTDCCIWDGITCDEQTGIVTCISSFLSGELNPALFNLSSLWYLNLANNMFDNLNLLSGMVTAVHLAFRSISGELNLALFNLSSLQYLDLSNNDFYNITLPLTGFQQLINLTHLYLSDSGFTGPVPISISALTNLISLDLSDFENPNPMYLHDTGLTTLLRNLTKLQVLRLHGVDLSVNGYELGKAVFQVGPTLQELSMAECGLKGVVPDEIIHLPNLTKLDLAFNPMLSGQLSEFAKESFLQSLYLTDTNFTGTLPESIGNLQYLLELGLYKSNFYGEVPPSIINLTRLQDLVLGSNRLTGMIPMSLFSHPSLEFLDLSNNQLSESLPEFSNGSSILEYMYLHNNNLQGQMSISIFIKHFKYLDSLDLSNNKLSIIEGENHNMSFYASLPQLGYLGLASCNLTDFPTFLSYQTNFYSLDLSNNSLTGEIPLSISNVTAVLDLSYNNLTGTIPRWLLEGAELEELHLKSNKLRGPLPRNISQACGLKTINLSENLINGSLPNLLRYCNSLEILDLGNNRIVNRFPNWLGNLKNLRVLVLRSNMFYGQISDMEIKTKENDSFFPMLKVLDISSNYFSGTLPKNIFVNLKAMMGASNTSSQYYIKMNVSFLPYVASVTYKGRSFDMIRSLGIFSYIDLSNNEFCGRIPEEFGQLKSLDVLNLSHNALIGSIPENIANLQQLQLLDLSSNQLSGNIPQELTSLTFLSELNLSYNDLVGEIPEAHQFSTFSNDSYLGNPELCGSPLSMQCAAAPSNHVFNRGFPSKSSTNIIGLSISIGLGLGVGFASVIWATLSWENGRKWFNFIIDRFYFGHFH